jgi:hypothetical protein
MDCIRHGIAWVTRKDERTKSINRYQGSIQDGPCWLHGKTSLRTILIESVKYEGSLQFTRQRSFLSFWKRFRGGPRARRTERPLVSTELTCIFQIVISICWPRPGFSTLNTSVSQTLYVLAFWSYDRTGLFGISLLIFRSRARPDQVGDARQLQTIHEPLPATLMQGLFNHLANHDGIFPRPRVRRLRRRLYSAVHK